MSGPLRVLIVEDSQDDCDLLVLELQRGDYDVAFERVETAEEMRAALEQKTWDIILSDHNLPQFNAEAAFKQVRARGLDLPFIVVSGTIGEESAVAAMRTGVSDYIIKNNLARLLPAIERELREASNRRALRSSEQFNQRVLDSLFTHIAVLNQDGVIIAANEAWRRFALENGATDPGRFDVGTNYLDVCWRATGPYSEGAQEAWKGIQAVLHGLQPFYELEYPCFSHTQERGFCCGPPLFRTASEGRWWLT